MNVPDLLLGRRFYGRISSAQSLRPQTADRSPEKLTIYADLRGPIRVDPTDRG